MGEILHIHIGQAGVNIGANLWEIYATEHGLDYSGFKNQSNPNPNPNQNQNQNQNPKITQSKYNLSSHLKEADEGSSNNNNELNDETLFEITSQGKHIPRCIFIDLAPDATDCLQQNPIAPLLPKSRIISGKESGASTFSRAKYCLGRELLQDFHGQLQKIEEKCDHLNRIVFTHSLGGGAGAGLASLIFEETGRKWKKLIQTDFCVFPSPRLSDSIVEPYNVVLGLNHFESLDSCIMMDNEAIYRICQSQLGIQKPDFADINHVIAHTIAGISYPSRSYGVLGSSFEDMHTSLIPYPSIKMLFPSYAPFLPIDKTFHESPSVNELTTAAFSQSNLLLSVDPSKSKYISSCLMYRGGVSPSEIPEAISKIKKDPSVQFVDFVHTGFKVGINPHPTTVLENAPMGFNPSSVIAVTNNIAFSTVLERVSKDFGLMYDKRAFVHWFVGEGMESGEFCECQENVFSMTNNYLELDDQLSEISDDDDDF